MYFSMWIISIHSKYPHAMLHVHWDSKPYLAFRWKDTHVSSSICTLASLDDINYPSGNQRTGGLSPYLEAQAPSLDVVIQSIPLDNPQGDKRKRKEKGGEAPPASTNEERKKKNYAVQVWQRASRKGTKEKETGNRLWEQKVSSQNGQLPPVLKDGGRMGRNDVESCRSNGVRGYKGEKGLSQGVRLLVAAEQKKNQGRLEKNC
eukprot:1161983-Pelagomonas_calceolata.AAC.5